MKIIEYIIYGISILITLGWCIQIRDKARNEQATEKPMELQGFLMTVSVMLIPLLHLSTFHLIWMIPASFILGLLSLTTPLRILFPLSSIYFSLWYIGINNLGRKYYIDGEYDKAIGIFKEEINKNPSSVDAYFNLALAYGKIGEHENEIMAYQEVIKLKPNKPQLHYNLGMAYSDIGNKQKALISLHEAIRLKPEHINAQYNLCKIYAEIGDYDNANKQYEIIKNLDKSVAEELTPFLKPV